MTERTSPTCQQGSPAAADVSSFSVVCVTPESQLTQKQGKAGCKVAIPPASPSLARPLLPATESHQPGHGFQFLFKIRAP